MYVRSSWDKRGRNITSDNNERGGSKNNETRNVHKSCKGEMRRDGI